MSWPTASENSGFMATHAVKFAAAASAVASVLSGTPLDSLKTRMQAQRYPSMMSCMKDTYQVEGIRGFYRGVGPILVTVSINRVLSFSIYTAIKADLDAYITSSNYNDRITSFQKLGILSSLSGLTTGIIVSFFHAPFEFIKVQMQLERFINRGEPTSDLKTTKSSFGWAKETFRKRGLFGLYHGAHLQIMRDAVGTAVFFSGYELMKQALTTQFGDQGSWIHAFSGGFAGTMCWIFMFPIDVVKSVIQKEALQSTPKYTSALHFAKKAWKEKGIQRFYRGIMPQLVRSFPVHSLNFLVFERVLHWCHYDSVEAFNTQAMN